MIDRSRPGATWKGGHHWAGDGHVGATVADDRPRPCLHLGDVLRLDDCATCKGTVRVKVYACSHPAHAETTLSGCRTCPDYQARG